MVTSTGNFEIKDLDDYMIVVFRSLRNFEITGGDEISLDEVLVVG